MGFREPWVFQFKIFVLKNSLFILLFFVVISPIIAWGVAHLNLYILQIFACVYIPFPASTFISSTMIGLITLIGVSLTIIWNYHLRQRELATKKVYVVDRLLDEIKINKKIALENINILKDDDESFLSPSFLFDNWVDLGEMITLLPRDLYTLLSVMYGRLKEIPMERSELEQVVLSMESVIEKLYRYRKELRTLYEVRSSKEDKKAKKEFENAYKQGKKL